MSEVQLQTSDTNLRPSNLKHGGDHLAEVQVCELLAECYLRQKKLQKAVQLYKQALSALSYCKITHFSHLEDAKAVQDRLVDHLCAALQQSLTVTQRSRPGRTRPYLPHPHSSSVEQRVRKTDMEQSLAANQQLDDQRAESS
ncbi:hypothetical protein ILYODFUR_033146, partial [Ilyodon furcidens]